MQEKKDHYLNTFLLECSSANEPMQVLEAFRTFTKKRLQTKEIQFIEQNKSLIVFPDNMLILEQEDKIYFHLKLIDHPHVVEIYHAKDVLSDYEIETIGKSVKIFSDKFKLITDLRGLTYTDDVTGLYNQRYMETVIDRELALAKRNDSSVSILFIDLDFFKKINDTHGHLVGSKILYEIGEEIKRTLRESDITFRFGGDEFVCVLSNTNLVEAMLVAERVRVRLEKKRFLAKEGLNIRITASIGVASYPEHAITREDILNAADEALYGVKDGTRNKVVPANIQSRK